MTEQYQQAHAVKEGLRNGTHEDGTAPAANPVPLPDLTHYLDEALAQRESREEPRRYLGISQLGSCARATAFGMEPNNYPAEHDAESIRFFNEGNLAEEDIVTRLIEGGCDVWNRQLEVTFPEGHPLHEVALGHIDGEIPTAPTLARGLGMIPYMENHPYGIAILEVKSLRAGALAKLAKAGSVSESWPHYGIQAHTYAYCRDRSWVAFVVKDRNSGEIASYWEPIDMDLVSMGVEQGMIVKAAHDAGSIAPRDYDPAKAWQCRTQYCRFRTYCLEAGE